MQRPYATLLIIAFMLTASNSASSDDPRHFLSIGNVSVFLSGEWVADNPDAMRGLKNALSEGIALIADHLDARASIPVLVKIEDIVDSSGALMEGVAGHCSSSGYRTLVVPDDVLWGNNLHWGDTVPSSLYVQMTPGRSLPGHPYLMEITLQKSRICNGERKPNAWQLYSTPRPGIVRCGESTSYNTYLRSTISHELAHGLGCD